MLQYEVPLPSLRRKRLNHNRITAEVADNVQPRFEFAEDRPTAQCTKASIPSAKPRLAARMLTNVALASEYGQLGEPEVSHNAVRELLAIRLDRAVVAREESGIPP